VAAGGVGWPKLGGEVGDPAGHVEVLGQVCGEGVDGSGGRGDVSEDWILLQGTDLRRDGVLQRPVTAFVAVCCLTIVGCDLTASSSPVIGAAI
jgi:hypothetical protein